MLRRFREWLTRELRAELEYFRNRAFKSEAEAERLQAACKARSAELANMQLLIRALRDVNADLDRRLVNGEN